MPRPKSDPNALFWPKVIKSDTCWLWNAAKHKDGYGRFYFNNRNQRAHRIAWILTNGDIELGLNVCHKCDTPLCVNPNHLFLGTHSDNTNDKVSKGRARGGMLKGEKNPNAVVDNQTVFAIRSRIRQGVSVKDIRKEFKVTNDIVYDIKNNKTWRHL